MPVYIPGMTISDDGNLVIDANELDVAGVRSVEFIEGEPEVELITCPHCGVRGFIECPDCAGPVAGEGGEESYHNRMWNIPFGCDTRRAAAEIALEADNRIAELEARLELWRKSEEGTLAQMAETNERFEGALSKITELEAQLAEANYRVQVHSDIAAENNLLRCKAQARAADLAKALEQVEWIYEDGGECPWCRSRIVYGHKPDCARQSALRQSEGE